MFSRVVLRILAVLLALAPVLASGQDQAARTWKNGKPLIRVWYPATLADDHDRFLGELATPPQDPAATDAADKPAPVSENPKLVREGLLMYFDPLRVPAIPSDQSPAQRSYPDALVLVRFRKIPSRDAFEKFVRKETGLDSNSEAGTLQTKGNGFEYSQQFYTVQIGTQRWSAIPDFLKTTSCFWRYRDGYVFHGNAPEIMTMHLPDRHDLEPPARGEKRDIYAEMDFDALLPRHRKPLWEMIRLRFEAQLQQRDDESPIEFALRKAAGEFYFHLLQALAVDVKSVQLAVDFADEQNPAVFNLEITSRTGSDLASALGSTVRRNPRLSSLIEQPAVLTLATSWGMPEQAERTVDSLVEYFRKELIDRVGLNFETVFAFDNFVEAVRKSVDGNSELVLKMTRSDEGFTLFGGVQLEEAAAAADSLGRLLDGLTSVTGGGVSRTTDYSGHPVLSFHPDELPSITTGRGRDHLPAEAHFTVVGTVLYFSFGGRDSLDVLQRAIDGRETNGAPSADAVPLALVEVSLDRWLNGEEKNAPFNRLPQLALETAGEMLRQQLTSLPGKIWHSRNLNLGSGYIVELDASNANQSADEVDGRVRRFSLELTGLPPAPDDLRTDDRTDDLKRHLKDRQSRVRVELFGDKRKAQLKATAGLGVIKWICSSLMQSGQPNSFDDITIFTLSTQVDSTATDAAIRFLELAPSAPDK